MNRADPHVRSIARQLLASESAEAEANPPAEFRATDKLRPHLSMLMGGGGFQALLARALVLATVEAPWLAVVRVVGGGELEGLAIAHAKLGAAEFSEGEAELLAQLIGLLVAFIGPALTLRLIHQIWPRLSFDDADLGGTANQ